MWRCVYLTTQVPTGEPGINAPIEFRDGGATVPDEPGLGVDIDEDKLAFYAKNQVAN